jgi:hypothetical protein
MRSRLDSRKNADADTVVACTWPFKNTAAVLPRHYEHTALISASPDRVFSYVDDQTRLSSQMRRPSWRMASSATHEVNSE